MAVGLLEIGQGCECLQQGCYLGYGARFADARLALVPVAYMLVRLNLSTHNPAAQSRSKRLALSTQRGRQVRQCSA